MSHRNRRASSTRAHNWHPLTDRCVCCQMLRGWEGARHACTGVVMHRARDERRNHRGRESAKGGSVMEKAIGCLLVGVVFLVLFGAFGAFTAALFWLAWNFVVPSAFAGPSLSFWQAWALWSVIGLVGGCFRAATSGKGKS